ncbi:MULTISPECIES: sensor histidine kinase [unclassified Curtobacterium]|uniref:sensor histidine kinase n=1 Tax=unclassified Curtobacterium TaxID=257496 RepID=UPI000FACC532|nr:MULTISPECIES: histidine kinase [unclassified Curtobacterium]ROQ04829.1 signal transduction histidine kinase [Curtobacterium sp. PhB171]ROQ28221.1 signal transduction histidine kinase [Curtobacterium sp. PhB170]ROS33247.1 signal transduction histidine kinase [Curtobacterium sp. PhB131]ROS72482.1 signal transduction histidine kinase [Curtobacterium sp. PhB141]
MTPADLAPGAVVDGTGGIALPDAPGRLRRFWARHPVMTDVLLMVFWGAIEVVVAFRSAWQVDGSPAARVTVVILVVIAVSGIPLRRTHPAVTAVLGLASVVAMTWTQAGYSPVLFTVYAATVWWSRAAGWWTAAVAVVLAAGATALRVFVVAPGSGGLADVLYPQPTTFLLAAVLIGVNVSNRRRYTQALIDRAHQLARERDQQAQLATAAERARIAREMHDIVSHSLTVMVRLAEGAAAGVTAGAPTGSAGSAAAAMRGVADVGRGAMGDMRRMLGVLGGDGEPALAPQPGIHDVPQLVDRFRALGTPVALELVGVVPDDDALQLAVYRVVQEGLTNTARHAQRVRSVDVRVAASATEVTVVVTDDGRTGGPTRPAGSAHAPAGSGRGLIGIDERIRALGGKVRAGSRDGTDGWQIRATIPVRAEDR